MSHSGEVRALAVSVVGHSVLVGAMTQVDRMPQVIEEPAIIEIELVDPGSDVNVNVNVNVNVDEVVSEVVAAPVRGTASQQPPSTTTTTTTGKSNAPTRGVGPDMLAMRTGTGPPTGYRAERSGPIDLSPQSGAAAVVADDAPIAPPVADTTADEYMRPTGGGTYEYKHPGFKGKIARDGSVTFKDTPAVVVDWGLPCIKCISEDFKAWKKDPKSGRTVNLLGLLPILRGSFDFTDLAERFAGNDPYSYEKNKFLEATRERRAAMSASEKRDATRQALLHLPKFLAAVWAHDEWSATERRRVLFQLWDECAESDAGAQARGAILGFIRKNVDEPYGEEELAELNSARTSTEEFEPYTKAEPRE